MFKDQGLDKFILNHFELRSKKTDLKNWRKNVVEKILKELSQANIT